MLEVYGSIGILAGVAQVLYLGAAFTLGGHLLLRSRQSGDTSQLLLGLHLLLAMGCGYLLISLGLVSALYTQQPSPHLVGLLIGSGYLCTTLGLLATLIFNVKVFRPGSRTALAVAGLVSLAMFGGWAGWGLSGGFPTARYEGFWMWTQTLGILAANFWVAFEPLLYHRGVRRRVRIGLAEPLVADRFLLWGLGSLTRTAMVLLGAIGVSLQERMGADAGLLLASSVLVSASLCGVFTSVTYWLAFRPTGAYARWVQRRYAAPQG